MEMVAATFRKDKFFFLPRNLLQSAKHLYTLTSPVIYAVWPLLARGFCLLPYLLVQIKEQKLQMEGPNGNGWYFGVRIASRSVHYFPIEKMYNKINTVEKLSLCLSYLKGNYVSKIRYV